ncbi:hypothetical protein [Desulfothermobacter acidiphilus]|uniref:hypothetical protein n=1 Tax=Desulfothermobacter acidiphilus TaxID=1938353 RepID=UPI003F8A1109
MARAIAQEEKTRESLVESLAQKLDLSVTDLWILALTAISLGILYGIGEVAARLGGV